MMNRIAAFWFCLATACFIAPCLGQTASRPASMPTTTSAPASQEADATTEPTTVPAVDLGCYAPMVTDCNLSTGQRVKLAKKALAVQELAAEEQAQSAAILEKLAQAYKDKDNEQVKRLQKEMSQLRRASQEVTDSLQAEILSILSKDQRLAWETGQLERKAMAHYRQLRFDLTAQQVERLHEACKTEGEVLSKTSKWPNATQAREAMDMVNRQVLTDDQRRRASRTE
jgi:hypothetical protein